MKKFYFLKFLTLLSVSFIFTFSYFTWGEETDASSREVQIQWPSNIKYRLRSGKKEVVAKDFDEILQNHLYEDILRDEVFIKHPELFAITKEVVSQYDDKTLTRDYRLEENQLNEVFRGLARGVISGESASEGFDFDNNNADLLNQGFIGQADLSQGGRDGSRQNIRSENVRQFLQTHEGYHILETIRDAVYHSRENEELIHVLNENFKLFSTDQSSVHSLPEAIQFSSLKDRYPVTGKRYKAIQEFARSALLRLSTSDSHSVRTKNFYRNYLEALMQKGIRFNQTTTTATLSGGSSSTELENDQNLDEEDETWISNFSIGDATFNQIHIELKQLNRLREKLRKSDEKLNSGIEEFNKEIEELESIPEEARTTAQQHALSHKQDEKKNLEEKLAEQRKRGEALINQSIFILQFRVERFFADVRQTFRTAFQLVENLDIENVQPYKEVTFGMLQLAQGAALVATAGQISLAAFNAFAGGLLGMFSGFGFFSSGRNGPFRAIFHQLNTIIKNQHQIIRQLRVIDQKLDYIQGAVKQLEATVIGNQQRTISYLEIIEEKIEELGKFSYLSLDVFSSVTQERELKGALSSPSRNVKGYQDIKVALHGAFPTEVLPREIYYARNHVYRVFKDFLIDFKSLTFYPLNTQESLPIDTYRENLHQTPFNGSFANLLTEWKAFSFLDSNLNLDFRIRSDSLFQNKELMELIEPKNLLFILKHYVELTLLFDPELENNALKRDTKSEINKMCQSVVRLKQASREMRRALPVAWEMYKEYLEEIRSIIFYKVYRVQNTFIKSFPEKARVWWRNEKLSGKDPLIYSKSTCQEVDLEKCYNEEDYLDIYEYEEFITRHGEEIHRNESNESLIKSIPLEDTGSDDSDSLQRDTRQVLYPYQYPPDAFKMTPKGVYDDQLKALFQSGDESERERFYELASYKRPFYDFVFHLGRPYYTEEKEADSTDCSKWQRECTQAWMTYEYEGGRGPNGESIIPAYHHGDYSSYEGAANIHLTVTPARENLADLYSNNNFFPVTSLNFRSRLFNQVELFRYCYRNQFVRDTAGGGKIYKCLVLLPFDNRGSLFKSYHIRSTPTQEWHLKNPALLLGATGYANNDGRHIPMRESLIALENPEEIHGGFHQRAQDNPKIQGCETWGEPIFCKNPRRKKFIKTEVLMNVIRRELYSYRKRVRQEIEDWYRSDHGKNLLNNLSRAKLVLEIFAYGGYVKSEQFGEFKQLLEKMRSLLIQRSRLSTGTIQEGEAINDLKEGINNSISALDDSFKKYMLMGSSLLQVLERAPSGFEGDRSNVRLPKLPFTPLNYKVDDVDWFNEGWMKWFDTWWGGFIRWKEWVVDRGFGIPEKLPLPEGLKYENLESDGSSIFGSSGRIYDKDHQFLGLGFGEYFQEVRDLLRQIDAENSDFMPQETSDGSCLKELRLGEFYDVEEGHQE